MPAELKSQLRGRRMLDHEPSLDEVFLDATGRTRVVVAGQVQELR
jgi:ABC-2 type transport system ATP-binding protein